MEQPAGTQGQSARRPRNNRRQTPLPAGILPPQMGSRLTQDDVDRANLLGGKQVKLISSRGGRRGGLIPTAPIQRIRAEDLPTDRGQRAELNNHPLRCTNCASISRIGVIVVTAPIRAALRGGFYTCPACWAAANTCANCHQTVPGDQQRRNTLGQIVHRHTCPPKRVPPPPH